MVRISVNGLCPSGNYFDEPLCNDIRAQIARVLKGTRYANAQVAVNDRPVLHGGEPKWSLSVIGEVGDSDEVQQLLTPLHTMFCERFGVQERVLVARPA